LNLLKKFHWFEITLIALVMGVHIYVAFSAPHNFPARWFTRDDAFYYFKVAQNISEGHGSTFDGINLTNGYHPLWMLVCIPVFALARFDLILPLRILLVLMAALSTTTSILLFRLLKKQVGQPTAMLAAAFWAFSLEVHSIITQQGMETGIVALSIVLFLFMLQKAEARKTSLTPRDFVFLGIAALFVLFSRLDSIYIVLIAGIWVVFRRSPIRYMLPLDLLLTFSVIVGAFIQRAGLKIYLLAFDSSAITMAAVVFLIQTIVFYFTGLYTRPASLPALRIFIMTLVGVTLSAIISTAAMFALAAFGAYDLPRAVPALYWVWMLGLTLLTRFGLRIISPWPVTLSKDLKPFQGFLAGKNHVRAALEPLTKWFQDGLVYFGIVGAGLIVYMGINRLLFGTFMPVSGQIKQWWGSLPNDVYGGSAKSFLDVFGIDPTYSQAWNLFTNPVFDWAEKLSAKSWNFDGWYWLIITVFVLVLLALFLRDRKKNLRRIFLVGIIPLLISAELHTFFYGAMSYASKHEWYWVMQMLALVILGALGIGAILDQLPRQKTIQLTTRMLAIFASLYLAYGFSFELINRMPYQDPLAGQPYMDTLPILEGYTQPGALIGMTGGGNAGYFIKGRTIVNMDGLINSYTYFQALKENQGGKYLAKIGLTYIFANRYIITNSMPYRYQFSPEELISVDGAPVYGQKELMRYVPVK
jgi:hypothetical protein